jgi:hypothetical protein
VAFSRGQLKPGTAFNGLFKSYFSIWRKSFSGLAAMEYLVYTCSPRSKQSNLMARRAYFIPDAETIDQIYLYSFD